MVLQFLLFVIAVLLVSVFWELTKITSTSGLFLPRERTMTGRRKTPHESGNRWNGGCKCYESGSISAMAIFRRLGSGCRFRAQFFRLGENTCLDEMKARQAALPKRLPEGLCCFQIRERCACRSIGFIECFFPTWCGPFSLD
jgi:hypothetical protein